MKALSIKQPWAWLIAKGYKDIENRDWPTKYRGRIYIHASKSAFHPGMIAFWLNSRGLSHEAILMSNATYAYGAIIGEVDIVGCVTKSDSPWFCGVYGFVLANPKEYSYPIPLRGKLGLFDVPLL